MRVSTAWVTSRQETARERVNAASDTAVSDASAQPVIP